MQIMNADKSIANLTAKELYPNKFQNFHKCSLIAALWDVPPYLILPAIDGDYREIKGVDGYLLNILAEVLNFTVEFVIPPNNEQRGLVRKDGSLTGAIKLVSLLSELSSQISFNNFVVIFLQLHERLADLSLGSFRCTLERSTVLSPSSTFYQTMQVFTVLALKQPWTSYEIITYPFDKYIWTLFFGLLLVLLISNTLLKIGHGNILQFVYGNSSISTINSNIIAMSLGQPCSLEPQRNFARYFATLWILLTFILRSTYQGSLYDFLNSQKTIDSPDTSRELNERQYKLIVNTATADSFSQIPAVRDKLLEVLIMNISDTAGFPLLEANMDKRYVTGTPRDFLLSYVNIHKKFGVFHILKETIFSQQLCVYYTKHSYLINTIDLILQRLRSFGLIYHWARQVFDDRFLEKSSIEPAPDSLGLSQLSCIFVACLYLYSLATLVFIFEIAWHRFYNRNT